MKALMISAAMVLAISAVGCSRHDDTPRTNAAIAAEVRHDLAEEQVPGVIDVAFTEGTATLSGTVPDAEAKARAAHVADDVNGVERVVNNLRTTIAADAPIRPDLGRRPLVPEPYPNEVAPNAPPPMR